MAPILVGDPEADIGKLAILIMKPPMDYIVLKEWKTLALCFGLSLRTQYELEREGNTTEVVIAKLLTHWVNTQGSGSTLNELLDILEIQCGWKATADHVWEATKTNIPEGLTWSDLHPKTKRYIKELRFGFLEKTQTLQGHFCGFDEPELSRVLENMPSNVIRELVNASRNYTINSRSPPVIPSYYIPRTITCTRKLCRKIFQQDTRDKFVISGITREELADLAGNESIEKSWPLKEHYMARYIRLVNQTDYEYIKTVCINEPVHHVLYKDGEHYWLQSQGSISLILDHLKLEMESWNEQEFMEMIQSERKLKTVFIADCPGMGKSLLLASLYDQIKGAGLRCKLYVTLSELAKHDIDKYTSGTNSALDVIARYTTTSGFGRYILLEILTSNKYSKYLYLDGFDEVSQEKHSIVIEWMKQLSKIENLVIVAATRLHKELQLGSAFGALPFKLQPIMHEQQVYLLLGYWKQKSQISDIFSINRVRQLACQIIRKSTNKITSDMMEFAGIPLQCRMLAEIYLKEAVACCSITDECLEAENMVQSFAIYELFSKLIETKMTNIPTEWHTHIIRWHISEAIKIFFPERYEDYKKLVETELCNTSDVINQVGICIITGNREGNKFVHLSYAEYFVARWILQLFSDDTHEDEVRLQLRVLLECVLNPILPWKSVQLEGSADIVELYEFWKSHPQAELCREHWEKLMQAMNTGAAMIYEARRNWMNCLSSKTNPYSESQDILYWMLAVKTKNWKFCLQVSDMVTAVDQCKFFKLAADLSNKYYKKDCAFTTIGRLINSGLGDIISHSMYEKYVNRSFTIPVTAEHSNENLQYILESCMRHENILLFQFLVDTVVHKLVVQSRELGTLEFGINWVSIAKEACQHSSSNTLELVIKSANEVALVDKQRLIQDLIRNRIVNTIARRGNFEVFSYAFQNFNPSAGNLTGALYYCLFNTAGRSESELQDRRAIVKRIIELHPTLARQKIYNVGFPLHVDNIHLDLVKMMIQYGADVYARDGLGDTAAHTAARHYSGETFHSFCEMMISFNYVDVFEIMNDQSYTALMCALQLCKQEAKTISLLESKRCIDFADSNLFYSAIVGMQSNGVFDELRRLGVNVLKRGSKFSQTYLHVAALYGNVEAVTYLCEHGLEVNLLDSENQTPLHWAIGERNPNIHKTVQVLLKLNVDVEVVNVYGETALARASRLASDTPVQERTIKLLQDKMDNVNSLSGQFPRLEL